MTRPRLAAGAICHYSTEFESCMNLIIALAMYHTLPHFSLTQLPIRRRCRFESVVFDFGELELAGLSKFPSAGMNVATSGGMPPLSLTFGNRIPTFGGVLISGRESVVDFFHYKHRLVKNAIQLTEKDHTHCIFVLHVLLRDHCS